MRSLALRDLSVAVDISLSARVSLISVRNRPSACCFVTSEQMCFIISFAFCFHFRAAGLLLTSWLKSFNWTVPLMKSEIHSINKHFQIKYIIFIRLENLKRLLVLTRSACQLQWALVLCVDNTVYKFLPHSVGALIVPYGHFQLNHSPPKENEYAVLNSCHTLSFCWNSAGELYPRPWDSISALFSCCSRHFASIPSCIFWPIIQKQRHLSALFFSHKKRIA